MEGSRYNSAAFGLPLRMLGSSDCQKRWTWLVRGFEVELSGKALVEIR